MYIVPYRRPPTERGQDPRDQPVRGPANPVRGSQPQQGRTENHRLVRLAVAGGDRALAAQDLRPLVVSIDSLATVVNRPNRAVLEPQNNPGRVEVARLTDARIHPHPGGGEHFLHLTPDQEAG